MDDALTLVPKPKICETKGFDVFFKRETLCPGVGFLDKLPDVLEVLPRRGWDILNLISTRPSTIGRGKART